MTTNKKNLLSLTILYVAMIAGCVSLTACGDDEPEPDPQPTNQVTTVKTDFSVSLSEAWFDYFDIEVTYTAAALPTTQTLTTNWDYVANYKAAEAPATFVCTVIAKPKANMPAIDPDATYLLSVDIQASVLGLKNDGTSDADYGYRGSNSSSQTLNASGMERYIASEHHLLDFTYTPGQE